MKFGRWYSVIYDSRNYLVLIDADGTTFDYSLIYDSRNYLVLIDNNVREIRDFRIYDSRNYLVLIDSYFLQNYIKSFI